MRVLVVCRKYALDRRGLRALQFASAYAEHAWRVTRRKGEERCLAGVDNVRLCFEGRACPGDVPLSEADEAASLC